MCFTQGVANFIAVSVSKNGEKFKMFNSYYYCSQKILIWHFTAMMATTTTTTANDQSYHHCYQQPLLAPDGVSFGKTYF